MDRPWMKHVVEGNPKEIELPTQSITQFLDESIKQFPNHVAMTFFGKTYTYNELSESIEKAAHGLTKLGVEKGDRVAIMLPNCPQYPISFYGTLLCGATIVQVNPMYKASELIHILNDSGAETLIIMDKLMPLYEGVKAHTAIKTVIPVIIESALMPDELQADVEHSFKEVTIDPQEDVAVLQYTGGTTGTPKGAMLTHFNIVANTLQSVCDGC